MKPNRIESIILAVIAVALVWGLIVCMRSEEVFRERFVVEDGWIEWITVFALAAGAVLFLKRAFTLTDKPWVFFRLACFGAGLLLIFGAGEEISWGQRLFGLEAPDIIKDHNKQSELTLHNLVIGGVSINKLFSKMLAVGIISYTLILPILYRKFDGVKRFVERFAIPIARPIHTVAWVILIGFTEGVIPSKKSGEMTEFGGSLLFLLIFLFPLNDYLFRKIRSAG